MPLAEGDDPIAAALEWAGSDGPEVVYEATGAADVARTAVELVAQAGRVVVVGLGTQRRPAPDLATSRSRRSTSSV